MRLATGACGLHFLSTGPERHSRLIWLQTRWAHPTSVAKADFFKSYIAGINACSTRCGTRDAGTVLEMQRYPATNKQIVQMIVGKRGERG